MLSEHSGPAMSTLLGEQLKTLYTAFRLAKIDFVHNAFDDQVEFISYSPLEVFLLLGQHRGKAAMERVLKASYEQLIHDLRAGLHGL